MAQLIFLIFSGCATIGRDSRIMSNIRAQNRLVDGSPRPRKAMLEYGAWAERRARRDLIGEPMQAAPLAPQEAARPPAPAADCPEPGAISSSGYGATRPAMWTSGLANSGSVTPAAASLSREHDRKHNVTRWIGGKYTFLSPSSGGAKLAGTLRFSTELLCLSPPTTAHPFAPRNTCACPPNISATHPIISAQLSPVMPESGVPPVRAAFR